MNYLEIAAKILEEVSRPLTCQQITAIAQERNWVDGQNGDPAGMMNSLIMQELKLKGIRSDFSRIGPGTYTLRKLVYRQHPESDQMSDPAPDVEQERERHRPSHPAGNDSFEAPPPPRPRHESRGKTPERRRHYQLRPVSSLELWQLMEALGTGMGYKINDVVLTDGVTHCMGWHIGGNPELAFILWINDGESIQKGINDLLDMKYHKIILMVPNDKLTESETFVASLSEREQPDVIPIEALQEKASAGIRFIEFYNRLCDCRPPKERDEPTQPFV